VLAASAWGAASGVHAGQPLRVASYGNNPPWSTLDDGKPGGFEIELVLDLCRRLDVACTILVWNWGDLIPALNRGDVDLVVSALAVTPERERLIGFSRPYAVISGLFATRSDSPLTDIVTLSQIDLADRTPQVEATLAVLRRNLARKRIGVQGDSVNERFLRQELDGTAEIVVYGPETDIYTELLAGRLDAILDTGAAAQDKIGLVNGKGVPLKQFGPMLTGGIYDVGTSFGFRKDDDALRIRFDQALAEAKADGTASRLAVRWFGYNASAP
jgi:octopine/nopaline transport system substrate-binding protein